MTAPNLLGETKSPTAPNLIGDNKTNSPITIDPVDMSNEGVAKSLGLPPGIKEDSGSGMHIVPKNQRTISPDDLPSTSNTNNSLLQHGTAPILAMQNALIKLASTIASHDIHSIADRTTDKNEFLTGANPFMNFLITNYANKASLVGKQFANTNLKQPTRMDTSKENDNLKGVLNTITRIGAPGKEQKADGVWGPRTNNALKQIFALATALLNVKQDMNVDVQGYDKSDLDVLYAKVPQDINEIKDINDKVSRAKFITDNLNKFTSFYSNFSDKILNDPNYRAHITQEKPLLADKASNGDRGKAQQFDVDQAAYDSVKSTPLDVIMENGTKVSIMPYDLVNMNNFKKFLTRNKQNFNLSPEEEVAVGKNDSTVLNKFISHVINNLTDIENLQTQR